MTVLRERVEKKEAEKLVKHVIKAAVKIGVLRRHNQLSAADERALSAFRSKFHVSDIYVITISVLAVRQKIKVVLNYLYLYYRQLYY